jgi:glycyl-tRNA synthetase beta chain
MNLLLEIGCEEIPGSMLPGALEYLEKSVGDLARNRQLGEATFRMDATPRRLVLRAEGLREQEPDSSERVWGPAKSAPPAAVAGFAKKQGVAPEALEIVSDGKVEKYSFVRQTAGTSTLDILGEELPQIIMKTPFPKTMFWPGKGGARFIRPIRWIVALFGSDVVSFEIAGVWAGNESSGHRKLGAVRFPVTYDTFEERLRENFVILSADERRARIEAVPTKYKCDPELLETLVYLTEWPTPFTGSFDTEFLALPGEVLTTVMRYHQKYFSVEKPEGGLAPQFVAVTNTDGDPAGLIRLGNERVLRARFNDARFFWDTDQKRKLEDRVKDLANVTFQAKLGTYLEKTERVTELAFTLLVHARANGAPVTDANLKAAKVRYAFDEDKSEFHAVRAARLCKADLTTELVKEFTELQGVVGGLYAAAQGEPEAVATAIYDHYKPVSMEDSIPRSEAGRVVAIADKLDTLRGCFKVGLIPSGSKDPFALRRAAQGIVKIAVDGGMRLPLARLVADDAACSDFFLDRVRYYFREVLGYKYDEVNAVIASGWEDLVDVAERLEAIREVRRTEDFEPVAAGFKRIKNILRQAGGSSTGYIDRALVEDGPEAGLYEATLAAAERMPSLTWRERVQTLASMRPYIDRFFDGVMVNVPDVAVRRNRLALLGTMLAEFSTIADFSEIVTGGEK